MSIAERAKELYDREWRGTLEVEHRDEYVAIEPESKSYFLDESFVSAALLARQAFPQRKTFVLRIGHDAAFHLGASST